LAEHLLSSPKDRLEHYYVVEDMLRCLDRLCDRLDAGASPHVLELATLQHLMTRARGHLKSGTTTGDILATLHPSPAVGGSPRDAALAAIRELEPNSRGWYAGPVGWYARDQAEFAVAIRSALLTENEMCVFAGAGIVQGSTPDDEWQETENKALAFLNALQ
jgi:isochorismate synthase EntC